MKVEEIMTSQVAPCGPDTDLAEVAKLMWDYDCGIVPVIDAAGKVLGVLTDRDICIGIATKGRTAAHVAAREVMSSTLHACFPGDDITAALEVMKMARVRRLPVIDQSGHLKGMLSLNDIILNTKPRATPSPDRIVDVLKSICSHRHGEELVRATA